MMMEAAMIFSGLFFWSVVDMAFSSILRRIDLVGMEEKAKTDLAKKNEKYRNLPAPVAYPQVLMWEFHRRDAWETRSWTFCRGRWI
jgi:hypothetical protein